MSTKHATNYNLTMGSLNKLVPTTRYQGSKRKILPWLYKNLKKLEFDTVLDGFGGTASVSYLFKKMGKKVTFNDVLRSNYLSGIAIIENESATLSKEDTRFILNENGFDYSSFIQENFKDIYYLDDENKWLDMVVQNIHMLSEIYDGGILKKKQAIAFHALFQACLVKRPYNLFHRNNLYMRLANVERSFGNKKTWDTGFEKMLLRFSDELSHKIFSNGRSNIAHCENILKMKAGNYDLVYLDPPYTKSEQHVPIDYYNLYHFLEGIADYHNWKDRIDWTKKHRCLINGKPSWDKKSIITNFDSLFCKFKDSMLVISYGDPGYPSVDEIKELLGQYKNKIDIRRKEYKYGLNHTHKNGNKLYEALIIAQ